MLRTTTQVLASTTVLVNAQVVCSIFFSEYAEGSGNNKYLELYNPTTTAVFLSQFAQSNCSNGCDSQTPLCQRSIDYLSFNFPFDAEIGPGGTYIVAHLVQIPSF